MGGYSVKATCDEEGCDAEIDRGLAYVCGDMHDGNEHSCGKYFCGEHLFYGLGLPNQMCDACSERFREEYPEIVDAAIADFEQRRGEWADSGSDSVSLPE
jgi:hypothetical protein